MDAAMAMGRGTAKGRFRTDWEGHLWNKNTMLPLPCALFQVMLQAPHRHRLIVCATSELDGAKGSGTTARGRRLLKILEDKRKREYDRLHNYPAWAKVLENACKDDAELRALLGDSIGNPELMRKRVEERVRQKGPQIKNRFSPCLQSLLQRLQSP